MQESGEADEDVSQAADLQAAEGSSGETANAQESGQGQKGMAGMGANLVSTVRSFLPFVSKAGDAQPQPAAGKKPVKVRNILPAVVNNQESRPLASRGSVSMTKNLVNAVQRGCRSGVLLVMPSGPGHASARACPSNPRDAVPSILLWTWLDADYQPDERLTAPRISA